MTSGRRQLNVRELPAAAVRVIEGGRARRARGGVVPRRELATELLFAVLFVAAAIACLLLLPPVRPFRPEAALLLGGVFIVLLRIEFEVGEGRTHPLQLVTVPMLFVLPPRSVPLVVSISYLIASSPRMLLTPGSLTRSLYAASDSWFTIGPAVVLALADVRAPVLGAAGWILLALVAQLAIDAAAACGRLAVGVGINLRSQLAMMSWAYLVDALLSPVGLLAAVVAGSDGLGVMLVVPLGLLLAIFASERHGRINNAVELNRVIGEREARQRAILQHSSDLIAITDPDGTILSVTGAAHDVYPVPQDAPGASLLDRVHPADTALVTRFLADVARRPPDHRPPDQSPQASFRLRFADDGWRHVEAIAANLVEDPGVRGLVLTLRDVDERKAFEDQLRHRVFHDHLTGLPNRALLFDRIEQTLARGDQDGCAIFLLAVEDMASVNERYGRRVGDELLIAVATRLKTSVSSADTVARLGGEEFAILLPGSQRGEERVAHAERIAAAFSRPLDVAGQPLRAVINIGVAVADSGGQEADDLLRSADLALYAARRDDQRSVHLFHPELAEVLSGADRGEDRTRAWLNRSREQRREIEDLLERTDALRPVFQPIVDLRTGLVSGYEALSRFDTPVRRAPDAWFAQAHRCGLGYQLEGLAVARALAVAGRDPECYLSLNLSPSALVADDVRAVLPADLHGIVIEITENELVTQSPTTTDAIAALRARGARLAVDDAGSGYAGLIHLMRLAPDMIKLDRALIDGVAGNPAQVALVESFVRYASRTGAVLCAEGIETLEDLEVLADLDVAYGQGYVLARPAEPWAIVDAEAAERCRSGLERVLAHTVEESAGLHIDEGGLERISSALARAGGFAAIAPLEQLIARELRCSQVSVRRLPRGVHDPLEGRLEQLPAGDYGLRALLRVPIRSAGRTLGHLEAQRDEGRPWSRRDVVRARILAHQLSGALERFAVHEALGAGPLVPGSPVTAPDTLVPGTSL